MSKSDLPELNKKYNCFVDGKIRESRRYEVVIKKLVPFGKICKKIKKIWKRELKDCPWLYAEKTDYFILADSSVCEEGEVFVRTKGWGWFGLNGWYCGRLDVDGSLWKGWVLNNFR